MAEALISALKRLDKKLTERAYLRQSAHLAEDLDNQIYDLGLLHGEDTEEYLKQATEFINVTISAASSAHRGPAYFELRPRYEQTRLQHIMTVRNRHRSAKERLAGAELSRDLTQLESDQDRENRAAVGNAVRKYVT